MFRLKVLAALMLVAPVLLLAACGGDTESSTPDASATATVSASASPVVTRAVINATIPPEATTQAATATPAPTDTPIPEPTATEVPPTDTPEPPTATPVPPTATSPPPPPPPPPPPTATTAPVVSGPQSLFITAASLKFSPAALYASPGASVTITLSNQDNFVPHNLAVTGFGTSGTCSGPCTTAVSFIAPGPGTYGFICTVHPYMTGSLIVQ